MITGASGGIGAAVARAVAGAGGRPILLARREAQLRVAPALVPWMMTASGYKRAARSG